MRRASLQEVPLAGIRRRLRELFERGFDPHIAGGRAIDTGYEAERAMRLCGRLNAVRTRSPKQAVVLWTSDYSAVTMRGKWVYVAKGFAQRLSDDALAFVLGHEMAHHDLDHMTLHMGMASMLGYTRMMELQADRRGMQLAIDAGFDPALAIGAFEPSIWSEQPEDPLTEWPAALREQVRRYKQSHPPLEARRAALREHFGL